MGICYIRERVGNSDEKGLKNLYYQSKKIDTTREYTFKFVYNGHIDARQIFVFNHKEFSVIVENKGVQDIIEGEFYPIG